MKKALSCALFVLIAIGPVIRSLGAVEETKSKSKIPSKAPAQVEDKKTRPLPFHGTVTEVDPKAQTITVGKRVFHLSETTKLMKDKSVIPLKEVLVGERVGGSYLKDDDGNLQALKLNFKGSAAKSTEKTPSKQPETEDSET